MVIVSRLYCCFGTKMKVLSPTFSGALKNYFTHVLLKDFDQFMYR